MKVADEKIRENCAKKKNELKSLHFQKKREVNALSLSGLLLL